MTNGTSNFRLVLAGENGRLPDNERQVGVTVDADVLGDQVPMTQIREIDDPRPPRRRITRLKEIRLARNLQANQLAEATGLDPSTISKYERGERNVNQPMAEKLAIPLRVPAYEIYKPVGSPIPTPSENVISRHTIPPSRVRHTGVIPALPPSQDTLTQVGVDVPVYPAASIWGHGKFVLQTDRITTEFAPRPPGLRGVAVESFYVVNDNMFPWRRPGELVYTYKTREAQVGNHVVVVLNETSPVGGYVAYLATLSGRDAHKLTLSMYKDNETVELSIDEVREIMPVVEWQDAFGIA